GDGTGQESRGEDNEARGKYILGRLRRLFPRPRRSSVGSRLESPTANRRLTTQPTYMEHLQKSIEDLTTALINLAKEESTKGTAEPEEEVLLQPRCKDFRY